MAQAAGQDEWQTGVYVLGAHARGPESLWGTGAGVDLQYGLTDGWGLRVATEASWLAPTDGAAALVQATAGVVYSWDVLRVLPVLEASLGSATVLADAGSQSNLGGQVGLGAEYLLDRRWSLSVVGRVSYLPLAIWGEPSLRVGTLALRLSYRLR